MGVRIARKMKEEEIDKLSVDIIEVIQDLDHGWDDHTHWENIRKAIKAILTNAIGETKR